MQDPKKSTFFCWVLENYLFDFVERVLRRLNEIVSAVAGRGPAESRTANRCKILKKARVFKGFLIWYCLGVGGVAWGCCLGMGELVGLQSGVKRGMWVGRGWNVQFRIK